jgi:hypothetical protein
MDWLRMLFSTLASYAYQSASEARRWFRAGVTFWIWLSLTVLILILFWRAPGELADRVRWAGALFEALGVAMVVIGVDRARRSFGKPSVFKGIWIWATDFRFIFWRRPRRTISVDQTLPMASNLSVATTITRASRSVEERVTELEKQISALQVNFDQKLDEGVREVLAELDKEAAARRAADQTVSQRLEEGIVGDSSLELAGAAYLCLGIVLVDLSGEVAMGLAWLGFA